VAVLKQVTAWYKWRRIHLAQGREKEGPPVYEHNSGNAIAAGHAQFID
jgi:hypothetical protein